MSKKELVIFLSIFLLGSALRLYHLDYPLGLHGDEAWTGIEALKILNNHPSGIWSTAAYGQPTLPFYLTALVFNFLGANLQTLRLSFALWNIIALPFFYLIAREIFDKKAALASFFLFSTARIPIHFAHIAFSAFLVPFLPAAYFYIKAQKTSKLIYFCLWALCLGLAPYFYPGLDILPIIFLPFVLYRLFKTRQLKNYTLKLLLSLVIFLLVFSPLLNFYLKNPAAASSRSNAASIFSSQGFHHVKVSYYPNLDFGQIIIQQTKATLLMFNFSGDQSAEDNLNSLPLFDPISGVFFIIGLCLSLRQIKKSQVSLLYALFFAFLLGSILTVDAPNFRRAQPSLVLSFLFAGYGFVTAYSYLSKLTSLSIYRKLLGFLCLTLLLLFGIYNFKLYFFNQAVNTETKDIFAYQLVEVTNYLKTLPPNTRVYFYSSRWFGDYSTLTFLSPLKITDHSTITQADSSESKPLNKNLVYIFLPSYSSVLEQIEVTYPGGIAVNHLDSGDLVFSSYFLQAK